MRGGFMEWKITMPDGEVWIRCELASDGFIWKRLSDIRSFVVYPAVDVLGVQLAARTNSDEYTIAYYETMEEANNQVLSLIGGS
jgi:hypothetical protein